jgi:hypothetical protein
MNLLEVLTCINKKIRGTTTYNWTCFGPDARYLEVATDTIEHVASIIYDHEDATVYAIEMFLPQERKAWRWVDDRFYDLYIQECIDNGVNPDIAYNTVRFEPVDPSELMLMLYEITKDPNAETEFNDLDDDEEDEFNEAGPADDTAR